MKITFNHYFRKETGQRNYRMTFFYFLPFVCYSSYKVFASYVKSITLGWLWFTVNISLTNRKDLK